MVEGGLRIGFMSGIMWGRSVKMAVDPINTGLMTPAPGTNLLFIATKREIGRMKDYRNQTLTVPGLTSQRSVPQKKLISGGNVLSSLMIPLKQAFYGD